MKIRTALWHASVFLVYSRGTMYYNAYVLLLQTGLRPGEVGGLKWEDIDFDKRERHVTRTLLQNKAKGNADNRQANKRTKG